MEKTIVLINEKIEGHKTQLQKDEELKEQLKLKLLEGKQQLQERSPKLADTAGQIFVINEKARFHETCIKVLEDLKKDIVGGV